MKRLLVLLLVIASAPPPLLACPEETVQYPPITVREMRGRIEPPRGDGLLPTEVTFLVREKGAEKFDRTVPVQPDGTFVIGLAEGTYEFQIKSDQYLFTIVGDVTISLKASEEASVKIYPSWC